MKGSRTQMIEEALRYMCGFQPAGHQFFFSCIAGQVRDMVGQQLEWACDWDQISPKKETNNQPNKTNKTSNTHTQAKARARQNSQGNLQTKWNQVKHTRPSQPLICSRPPCSTPPTLSNS